jgi:uroporphyrin-III C-methyltransferase / precorrin-2 dehydrogenase / sirohydrochlorin ferrochelatase
MIDTLPLFHRIAGQPVIVLGAGDAADAKRRLVERAGGLVIEVLQEGIDKGARLAFIAHDDESSAQADAVRARCAGLLVNAADRPELCDFVVPSILDRNPVLLAIGTGGASAGLAKALRLRLETLLPARLGRLAEALYQARPRMRSRWPDAGDRRRALDRALGEGGVLDPLGDDADTAVDRWLDGAEDSATQRIEIVLRSDDPEDLTLREARLLGSADVIWSEPGVAPAVIDRARADAVRRTLTGETPPDDDQGLIIVLRQPGGN